MRYNSAQGFCWHAKTGEKESKANHQAIIETLSKG
jgi:hypothetical protein